MARHAFSSLPSAKKSNSSGRKQVRNAKRANLNALALAESSTTDKPKLKHGRLGQIDDDSHNGQERSTKRRRVETTADEDDDDMNDNGGSDSEGNEWHYGIADNDDDSDIDSDEAFGASDEERFEDFTFRGSKPSKRGRSSTKPSRRTTRELDLSEQEGEAQDSPDEGQENEDGDDDDDLGDEAVDLATALDMNIATEKEEEEARQKHGKQAGTLSHSGSDEGSGSDEDGEEDSTDSSIFDPADDAQDGGEHSRLLDFVEDLNGQRATSKRSSQKQSASYMFENPTEFGIKPSKKLTAADLLSTVSDPRLRQSLKILHSAEKEEPKANARGIPGKLAPPLARRQQDRLDRAAAYEKSKETLNRWIDTVKQNRRAEHVSFPLPDPAAEAVVGSKQLLPTSVSGPVTTLETAIQNIMVESGLADGHGQSAEEKLQSFEELHEKKLPIEEVQARRAELRKARDLMFREEVRAKRIKKIKSKAYRRVHRKERDRAAQEERAALAAAGVLDSEEEREKADRRRAEERMGARHRESKWAKGMKTTGRAAWDDEARSAAMDMARRDEELRRRIEGQSGKVSGSEGDFSASTSDEDDDDSSVASGGNSSQFLDKHLKKLEAQGDDTGSGSRLNSLAFMQRAEAARKSANDSEVRQIRQELADDAEDTHSDNEEAFGRKRYGSSGIRPTSESLPSLIRNEFEAPLSGDEEDEESNDATTRKAAIKSGRAQPSAQTVQKKVPSKPMQVTKLAEPEHDTHAGNPWLSGKGSDRKKKESSRDVVVSATALLDANKPSSDGLKHNTTLHKTTSRPEVTLAVGSDNEETLEDHDGQLTRNEELVRLAFAGDDVFEDFGKEKAETMREEGDQIIDNALPGWGSWAGEGISKKALKAQKRKQSKFNTVIKGVQEDKRKDAKLDRVIINEKKVKKNSKYLATELPHPFESRQQYERSLRLPLGPEWSTKNTFQDATKPRVLLKQGVIRPMERPMV